MPSFIDCSVRRHRTLCAVNVRRIAEHERETEKTYGERTEWRTRYGRSRRKKNNPDKKETTEDGGGWRKKYEESTRLRTFSSFDSSFLFFLFFSSLSPLFFIFVVLIAPSNENCPSPSSLITVIFRFRDDD